MAYPVVVAPFLKVDGLTLFPFIFVRNSKLKFDKTLMRHEHIHLRQQFELLILPFYVCYLFNYVYNLIKFKEHQKAYQNILFEKEAYFYENSLNYLESRTSFAWIRL